MAMNVPLLCRLGAPCRSVSDRGLPSSYEPDARTRRTVPGVRGRAGPMLAESLQPTAAGHSLPRGALMDGALVQSAWRSVVQSLGLLQPSRWAFRFEGIRPSP